MFMQVTLTQYDPKSSSTDKVLPCTNPECRVASTLNENGPMCTDPVSPGACVYEILYVGNSSTSGYLLSDVMTYNAVVNGTNTVSTASVYFGSVQIPCSTPRNFWALPSKCVFRSENFQK